MKTTFFFIFLFLPSFQRAWMHIKRSCQITASTCIFVYLWFERSLLEIKTLNKKASSCIDIKADHYVLFVYQAQTGFPDAKA